MGGWWGGGGRLFEAGRLLSFSAFRMGAYSRWALIRGWALIRVNTVPPKKYTALRLVPRRSLLIPLSARSLGESGPVSLGDVTAHGRVQEWPSRERLGNWGLGWTALNLQV